MTHEEIEYLISKIPEDINLPYTFPRALLEFNEIQGEAQSILQKEAWLMMQPDFIWNYCCAFAKARRDLPELDLLHPTKKYWVECLYDIICGNYDEENELHRDIMKAIIISSYARDVERNLICSLLLIKDTTYETIGNDVGISGMVVKLYGHFFWNVKERLNDKAYINSLVFPGPDRGLAIFNPNYIYDTPTREKLLQAAINYDAETVLVAAQIIPRGQIKMEEASRLFALERAHAAMMEARLGGAHGVYPGMTEAGRMVQAEKLSGQEQKTSEDAIGIPSLYKSHPVLSAIDRMIEPSVQKMLELSKGREQKQLGDGKDKEAPIMAHKPKKNWAEYPDVPQQN